MGRIQVYEDPSQAEPLLRALTPRLADPRGGVLDLYLHADLGGRLGDPLHGILHAIRPPLGVGGLQQLGDPWALRASKSAAYRSSSAPA